MSQFPNITKPNDIVQYAAHLQI